MQELSSNPDRPRLFDYGELGAQIWSRLESAADDPDHPMHLAVLATVAVDRRPAARLMTLRGADGASVRLWFYTDVRSPKTSDLRVYPFATVVAYDPRDGVQIRLSGEIGIHTDDNVADDHWEQVEVAARSAYAPHHMAGPPLLHPRSPGAPDAVAERTLHARSNFAVLELEVVTIDWLQVCAAGQRRAVLHAATHWAAEVVAP